MKQYFRDIVVKLDGYVSPPQKEYLAKLNQNENPFEVPQNIKDELCDAAKQLNWNRYPVNSSPDLRIKLAQWHQVKDSQILLGNGSNQLLQTLLTAIVDYQEQVLFCPPTFSLFDLFTEIYGGRLIKVLHPPGVKFPFAEVMQKIKVNQPKLVMLCSPNNPTGSEIPLNELEEICKISRGIVFFDEAYGEFTSQSAIPLLGKYENLVISRTFSKAFSLAGLRFGYFLAQAEIISQLDKVNLPYNVNLFTELIALRLLDDRKFMENHVSWIISERERVYQEMKKIKDINVYPSAANFLLFNSSKEINLFQQLKDRGILVRNMSAYELLNGYQRVSIGSEQENKLFLQKLVDLFEDEK